MPLRRNMRYAPRAKKIRTAIIIAILLVVISVLLFAKTSERTKNILIGSAIVTTAALGVDIASYEIDFGTLRKTGSIPQSKKEYYKKDGESIVIIGETCLRDNLNCADFPTQSAAQRKYDECYKKIMRDNNRTQQDRSIDVYGLDGNNNGIVCEHLPG